MVSQGLWGAIEQYWSVEDKPRLDRRNSYFEDHHLNDRDALNLYLIASSVGITIVILGLVGVMI